MAHLADPKVLDRDAARAESQDVIKVACPLLEELTNIGTLVFGNAQLTNNESEAIFPLLASFLHVIEMCDGVCVLLRESSVWASVPLCRSMFEALLSLEYIAETDSDRRASAWWVSYMQGSRRTIERLDPRTQAGGEFVRAIEQDKTLTGWQHLSSDVLDRFYISLDKVELHPRYRLAVAEFLEVRMTRKRTPNWYALFGGPQDIKALAMHLRRGSQYDALYRQWSDVVHPMNLTRWVKSGSGFPPEVTRIRDPKVFSHLAFYSANFVMDAINAVVDWFKLPDAQFKILEPRFMQNYETLRTA